MRDLPENHMEMSQLISVLTLPPRWALYVGKDGKKKFFRLSYRWDGALKIKPHSSEVIPKKYILILDTSLLFRRVFRIPEKRQLARSVLLASAADAFPFDLDNGRFALGEKGGATYIFGCMQSKFDQLIGGNDSARAVLVSAGSEQGAILTALRQWLKWGALRDFLARPRPILPGVILTFLLVGILSGMAAYAVSVWMEKERELAHHQRAYIAKLRMAAEPLMQKRKTVTHMIEAEKALAGIALMPGGQATAKLNDVLISIPKGSRIDKITFEESKLEILGWGEDPQQWLKLPLLKMATIEYIEYPKENRFKLLFDLNAD